MKPKYATVNHKGRTMVVEASSMDEAREKLRGSYVFAVCANCERALFHDEVEVCKDCLAEVEKAKYITTATADGMIDHPVGHLSGEIEVKLTCNCGCGQSINFTIRDGDLRAGCVAIYTSERMEIALGLIPDGFEPAFARALFGENDEGVILGIIDLA